MFSTHQIILAALYKERQDAEWLWREEDDMDRIEQLNALYAFDYDEVDKATHDYGKLWDACFSGVAFESELCRPENRPSTGERCSFALFSAHR